MEVSTVPSYPQNTSKVNTAMDESNSGQNLNRRQRALDIEQTRAEQHYAAEVDAQRVSRYSKSVLYAHELAHSAMQRNTEKRTLMDTPSLGDEPLCVTDFNCAHLGKEIEEGNVEYKLQLVSVDNERIAHLVTQMHWRLGEGNGSAIYQIGVHDTGRPLGNLKVRSNAPCF